MSILCRIHSIASVALDRQAPQRNRNRRWVLCVRCGAPNASRTVIAPTKLEAPMRWCIPVDRTERAVVQCRAHNRRLQRQIKSALSVCRFDGIGCHGLSFVDAYSGPLGVLGRCAECAAQEQSAAASDDLHAHTRFAKRRSSKELRQQKRRTAILKWADTSSPQR